MDNVLRALQSKYEPVKVILERAGIQGRDWNGAVSHLHKLAKAGEIARSKDDRGWLFATLGAVEELPPEPKDTSSLPQWARRPVWTAKDGPIKNVWDWREPGHRCMWSAFWINEGSPEDFGYSVEAMTRPECYYEIRDLASRLGGRVALLAMNLSADENDACWDAHEDEVRSLLRECHKSYQDAAAYVGLWALSPTVHIVRQRPGWDKVFTRPERIARNPDGVWVWLREADNPREKGVALCSARVYGSISRYEQELAIASKAKADARMWGAR